MIFVLSRKNKVLSPSIHSGPFTIMCILWFNELQNKVHVEVYMWVICSSMGWVWVQVVFKCDVFKRLGGNQSRYCEVCPKDNS